jgi:hypothetical protein
LMCFHLFWAWNSFSLLFGHFLAFADPVPSI